MTDLRSEIAQLGADLRKEMAGVRAELLEWMFGQTFVVPATPSSAASCEVNRASTDNELWCEDLGGGDGR